MDNYELLSRSEAESRKLLEDGEEDLDIRGGSTILWYRGVRSHARRVKLCLRRLAIPTLSGFFFVLLPLMLLTPLLNPSYSRIPEHYTGDNPHQEKVFIVACIVDSELIRGAWVRAVVELVNAVGSENAFVSIYVNDSGPETKEALLQLAQIIPCEVVVTSEHLLLEDLPTVTLPNGEERVHRITYLAEIRNRAMRAFHETQRNFDKILFLNDVVFSGRDAANLLFATGARAPDYRTNYLAACAVDFIDPVKFYDTYATRDLDGYGVGVPFFPWFTTSGSGSSRREVLAGVDSVRVKSCWGGMVAFEARWFKPEPDQYVEQLNPDARLAFRAEEEAFWEASECCLIHADLVSRASHANIAFPGESAASKEIVMNPFVRVAYSESVFQWLRFTRRFERLYSVPHRISTWLARLPYDSPRRAEEEGREVEHAVWTSNDSTPSPESLSIRTQHNSRSTGSQGCYEQVTQNAGPGGFCGRQGLSILEKDPKPGERMWTSYPVPTSDRTC